MKEQYGKWVVTDRRQGFSIVHEEGKPGKLYALKSRITSGKVSARLISEVNALKELDHPNIQKLIDYDLEADKPYMVTELCEGGTLQNVEFTEWSISDRQKFFYQICEAFTYLYKKGYTKSDNKPKNIFLKADLSPVIGDFEYARKITEDNLPGIMQELCRIFWLMMTGEELDTKMRELQKLNEKIEKLIKQRQELTAIQ